MTMTKHIFIFVIMSLFATKLYAKDLPPMDPNILYGKLDNGLTYYIQKNTTPPKKLVLNLVIKAGSLMETDKQRGLAHLLEHMAFNGSKNFPKNSIDDYFNSIGLSIGNHFNASTGFENTTYKFEIPTDKAGAVEKGIHILSDIVSNLDLSDEAFERERKIVEEEWRRDLGLDDRHFQQVGKILFNHSRYFQRRPIGNIETIRNFAYEEGRKFYRDWYQPSSMAVFAVGDIEPAQIEQYIKNYFASLQNTKQVIFPSYSIPDFDKNQFVIFQDKKRDYVSFTILEKRDVAKINTYENQRLHVIHELTLSIFQKRLQELTHKDNPVVLESSFTLAKLSRDSFYHYCYAILDDATIYEGIEELITSMEIAKRFGFTQQELDQVKQEILIDYEQAVKESSTRNSKNYVKEYIRHFTEDEMIIGTAAQYQLVKDIYPSITLQDVNRFFKEAFNGTNRIIEISVPERIRNVPSQTDIDKIFTKVQSKALVQNSFKINPKKLISKELPGSAIVKREWIESLQITKITLANGANVYFKPTTFKKGTILFKARSFGGYSKFSIDQLYSAKYLDDILEVSNLGDFSVTELQNILPADFVNVRPMLGSEFEGLDGMAISKYKEELFQLIYLNLSDRRINQSVIHNYKKREMEKWENQKDLPEYTLRVNFMKSYLQDHPRFFFKNADIIKKINLPDLQYAYQDRFGDVSDYSFIFVGDFSVAEFEQYAAKYIGSLPGKSRSESYVDHGMRLNKSKDVVEVRELKAVKSSQGRYYNRSFVNNVKNRQICGILASMLTNVLHDEIREKQNLVYSISSNIFDIWKYPEEAFTFVINYESSPENVEIINTAIDALLANMITGDFDPKLLQEKKMELIHDYKNNINKNQFWAYALNEYIQNKEPMTNILSVESVVNSITKQDIMQLAKEIFNDNYIRYSFYSQG